MNTRLFSSLLLILACITFTSCDDDIIIGPTPDYPPITPKMHELICTKWVADSVYESNNNIVSIEFLYDGACYILTQYDPEKECNVSKFGHVYASKKTYSFMDDSIIGIVSGNRLTLNNSYLLKKDPNFVAPNHDNDLIGQWRGNYMNINNGKIIILNILDNERLFGTNKIGDNFCNRTISNYTYDDSTITFNGKTYPRKGKEITTDYGTYRYEY